MRIKFFDRQDPSNPLNGSTITDAAELESIVENLRNREPFFFELQGDNGYELLVGVGPILGCVQHSPSSGGLPYLMGLAPNHDESNNNEYVEFLMGGTLTPVPRGYCMPFELVKQITVEFLETGERSRIVSWEQF